MNIKSEYMRESCEKKIEECLYNLLLDYSKLGSRNASREFFQDAFHDIICTEKYTEKMSTLFLCSSPCATEKKDLVRFFADYLNRIYEIAICNFTDIQQTKALPEKTLLRILKKIGEKYLNELNKDECSSLDDIDSIIEDSIHSLGQDFFNAFYKELNSFRKAVNLKSIDYFNQQKDSRWNENYDIETINPKSQPNDNYDELSSDIENDEPSFSDIETDEQLLLADSQGSDYYNRYFSNRENDEQLLVNKLVKEVFGGDDLVYLERMKFNFTAKACFNINYKEIAELTELNYSTIRSYQHRINEKFSTTSIKKRWENHKRNQIRQYHESCSDSSNNQLRKLKVEDVKDLIINYVLSFSEESQKHSKEDFENNLRKNYPKNDPESKT